MTLLNRELLVSREKLCLVSVFPHQRLSYDEKSSYDFPKKFQECGPR